MPSARISLLSLALLSLLSPSAHADYFLDKIVSTQTAGYSTFDYDVFSINASGVVGFGAKYASAGNRKCVFIGNGSTITLMAQPSTTPNNQQERYASSPVISDNGSLGFILLTGSTGYGTYNISTSTVGAPINEFTYNIGPGSYYGYGRPDITSGGRVAFTWINQNGHGLLYLTNGGGPPDVLLEAKFDNSSYIDNILDPITVNDNGGVAFAGDYDVETTTKTAIFRLANGNLTPIAGDFNGFTQVYFIPQVDKRSGPSINNAGMVAFRASTATVTKGIFTGNGSTVTPIAAPTGEFIKVELPAINNSGDVAFYGETSTSSAIYLYSNGTTTRIVGTGDSLDGSTVQAVAFCNLAFNDAGQIAFGAALASGVQGFYRATPGTQAPASFNQGGQPTPRIAALGSTTQFTTSVSGLPQPTFQWKKGAAVLKGQTGNFYTISNVQLSHADKYSVTIKNPLTPAAGIASAPAELGVVDQNDRTINGITGKNVTFTVAASTNITGFKWYFNGNPVVDVTGHISGATKKSLTITRMTNGSAEPSVASDAGTYYCEVTLPTVTAGNLTANSGEFTLNILDTKPDITDGYLLPEAMVGCPYNANVPYSSDQNRTPTVWSVKPPLPAGLTLNKATGNISGTPTGALVEETTYMLTIKAANGVSASSFDTLTIPLKVKPLPAGTVGVFVGFMNRNSIVNESLGGRFDLTTMPNGTFSGKLTNGTAVHSFTGGKLVSDVTNATPPSGAIAIKRKLPLTDLLISFTFDPANDRLATLVVTDGTGGINNGQAWRNVVPAAGFQGLHTLGLTLATANSARPQGTGFASYTVAPTGKLTVSCTLADGVTFTTAGHISKTGEVLFFFNSTTTDSFLGKVTQVPGVAADFSDYSLSGTPTWKRRTQTKGTTYAAGFDPININAVGSRYRIPLTTETVLNLPYSATPPATTVNARLSFTSGDFGATGIAPDADLLIQPKDKSSVIPDANANRTTTFAVKASTAAFSGKITLVDTAAFNNTKYTRSVDYKGLLIRTPQGFSGAGFYLLPKVPAATGQTLKNTMVQSGKVELGGLP